MEVKWIEHSGKHVLSVDYRGCANEQDFLKILGEQVEIERKESRDMLVLVNFEGTTIPSRFRDEAAKTVKQDHHKKVKKQALVGIAGIKKIILNGFLAVTGSNHITAFDSEKDALAWLVS